jgi:hypothetical protein
MMRKMKAVTVLITLTQEGKKRLREMTAEQNVKNPDRFITPSGLAREIINQHLFQNEKEKEN